jgi:hypothetical protein
MKTFVPSTPTITADEVRSWFAGDDRVPPERVTLIAECLNECRDPRLYPARPPYLATERLLIRQYKAELARLSALPRVWAENEILELERRIACLERPVTGRRTAFTRAWTSWAPNIYTLFYDTLVDEGRSPVDAEIEARPLARKAVRRVFGEMTDDAIDKELRKVPREYLSGLPKVSRRRG